MAISHMLPVFIVSLGQEAIDLCMLAVNLGSTVPNLKSKIKEYLGRAELLKKTIGNVLSKAIFLNKSNDRI